MLEDEVALGEERIATMLERKGITTVSDEIPQITVTLDNQTIPVLGNSFKTNKEGTYHIVVKTDSGKQGETQISWQADETLQPALRYGYIQADDLVVARDLNKYDVVNYYFDENEESINFIVVCNDEENGVVMLPENVVEQVTLGANDPYAIAAFSNGAPAGYEPNEFERARWSYNHAITTLNSYAQKYLGDMALYSSPYGRKRGDDIFNEDESENMYVQENNNEYNNYFLPYNGKFKASNNLEIHTISVDPALFHISDYWLPSRTLSVLQDPKYGSTASGVGAKIRYANDLSLSGSTGEVAICYIDAYGEGARSITKGFIPFITLKPNIYVERILDASKVVW